MKMSKARGFTPMIEWKIIPWRKLERKVYKLQKRIYQASQRGDVKTVRGLQKVLMKSWSARVLSVRRVSQDNCGKKTAGVDGVKSLTPKQRLSLTNEIKLGTKVSPTRRVWIPKPGKEEKRPLGIPTMKDRALQALVKLALEPEWEALLNKLNTFPTIRRQIRAWLKAGVMDKMQYFDTSEGTPQGGVISPLLANIALHGMEERIKKFAETLPTRGGFGKRDNQKALNLIRYADDFLILHEDITVVQRCKEIISEWLNGMGLELKPSKTRMAHTLNQYGQEQPGFNFLGFNIRQFPVGKYHTGKSANGIRPLGFKTIITPSKDKLKTHYDKIAAVITAHKTAPQVALINLITPIIRGWANYYSTVISSETYAELDRLTFFKLIVWAKRRHPNKSVKWVTKKYWQTVGGDNWVFATRTEGKNPMRLLKHKATKIKRHVKVRGESSPYDGNLVYWSTRMGNNPEMPKRIITLLKKQKGKCTHCELYFREEDVMEVDHIIPKSQGGKDSYNNWQLLHRHCHDTKTTSDGSLGNKSGCNSTKPKPTKKLEKAMDKWVMRYA